MIVVAASAPVHRDANGTETRHVSNIGGLTQFGAYRATLPPGGISSRRHWHDAEDEFLYVLDGTATVIDDDGAHSLVPGDAACWRHGDPNGHHVMNRTNAPLGYLIVGSRVARDVCHDPDSGWRQINGDRTWQLLQADGQPAKQGDLPAELLHLMPRWGTLYDRALPAPRIVHRAMARIDTGTPEQIARMGAFEGILYSDTGRLSQFGAFVETLESGAPSSDRHWHEQEDEFLLMLAGAATVVENDGAHLLHLGDAACWPAGVPNGHHVVNRSATLCSYLIIGSRLPSDKVHYSDIDKLYTRENGVETRRKRDGSQLETLIKAPGS